jgi:hypothetical protein
MGRRYVPRDATIIKNVVTERLGLPVLTIEWDNFDPRSYNHGQYTAKLETFLAMLGAGSQHVNPL